MGERQNEFSKDRIVLIDYTNWRGERSTRKVVPQQIFFGSNEWHKDPCWLMEALDVDKDEFRCFSLHTIHSWEVGNV